MATVSIVKPIKGKLEVRIPYSSSNRRWFKLALGYGVRVQWDREKRCWRIARTYFHQLVRHMNELFGDVDIYTYHRSEERCTAACQNAKGPDCVCSCGGVYHKGGAPVEGWVDLGNVLVGKDIRRHWKAEDPIFNDRYEWMVNGR